MDLFHFDTATVISFYLTLFRISVVLFVMPFFGDTLPNVVKGALLIVLTLAVWPKLSFPATYFPAHPMNLAVMFAGEIVLGMALGIIVRMLIAAVQIGGAIINFQMGFSNGQLHRPLDRPAGARDHVLHLHVHHADLPLAQRAPAPHQGPGQQLRPGAAGRAVPDAPAHDRGHALRQADVHPGRAHRGPR